MKSRRFLSLLAVLLLTAFATADSIPAGTRITIRVGSELNSGKATSGQHFDGTLAHDVVVNGKTVAKAGSAVQGKVTSAKSSGRLHAPGQISVRLTSVDGIPVQTSSVYRKGGSHTKSNATKIGGGAAAGAVLGGVFGGGKGALIGAGAGAAAGTGVAAATGKKEAVIPAESMLSFTTTGSTTSTSHKGR
ncbi:MAG TPA: hypothetical protein VMT89_13640 [Candidatus Acidoferrales bacterium]|nr:hypothetical protein [Candidatus Acidoferrales bacterium]